MSTENTFDALEYFKTLAETNKLAVENDFHPCFCAGIDGINDVIQEFSDKSNFIMIDDTTSNNTYSRGVTFFDKNVFTVFIIAGCSFDDMDERKEKLNLCRRIFRQFHSRMIRDKYEMVYGDMMEFLDVQSVYSKDMPGYILNGGTGLYFMVNSDEPIDLTYNEEEWL